MNKETVCSVCWDAYKFPKLLPCKHTFCVSCLHTFLDGLEDKENLICPLCREPCYVPDKGFGDFPTNYFVPVEKIIKICENCQNFPVSSFCDHCNAVLCKRCKILHSHRTKARTNKTEDNDSDVESVSSLPLHLKWQLMQENVKTEFLYKQVSMFVGENVNEENRKTVRSMAFSQNGGMYVKLENNPFLLKYNKFGKIIARIELASSDVAGVLEKRDDVLLIAHFAMMSVVCYGDGKPEFQKIHFGDVKKFYPMGLAELSNGNIVVCGPTHLCIKGTCKVKECGLAKSNSGLIQMYTSKGGHPIKEFVKDALEPIFEFPVEMACSNKRETIAVCDTNLKKVVLLDYEGKVRGFYKGWNKMPYSLIPESDVFFPSSVCSTPDGNYIVSDPKRECLHVLNPYGKFIGILRGEEGDNLFSSSSLCVDKEKNIWVGNGIEGTVTVFKPSLCKNVFDGIQGLPFPILPNLFSNEDIHVHIPQLFQ